MYPTMVPLMVLPSGLPLPAAFVRCIPLIVSLVAASSCSGENPIGDTGDDAQTAGPSQESNPSAGCPSCCSCTCAGAGCEGTAEVSTTGEQCFDCAAECEQACADSGCPYESARECGAESEPGAAPSEPVSTEPCPEVVDGVALPFLEDFESYPQGPLVDATGSPWVRASEGRVGEVGQYWASGGAQGFEIYSFTMGVEIHYVPLALVDAPGQLEIELVYTPDGFFIYKDFATFGLGCVRSKFDHKPVIAIEGQDHELILRVGETESVLDNEVDYAKRGDDPIHTYVRIALDFEAAELKASVGRMANAELRATVPLPASLSFNSFFLMGGVNPTHFDDISITTR